MKTDREVADWYNEQVKRDPFNPPSVRRVAKFAECGVSTAWLALQVWEAQGLIGGRRKRVS